MQLPTSVLRPESLLLSAGQQGVLLELDRVLAGESFPFGTSAEERLQWSAAPQSVHFLRPFLISLLPESVEVHDLGSLAPVQRIFMSSAATSLPLSFCSCTLEQTAPASMTMSMSMTAMNAGGSNRSSSSSRSMTYGYICSGEQVQVLKMVPVVQQVRRGIVPSADPLPPSASARR